MSDLRILLSDNLFFILAFWAILISGFIVLKNSKIPLVLKILRFSAILFFSLFILNFSIMKTKKTV